MKKFQLALVFLFVLTLLSTKVIAQVYWNVSGGNSPITGDFLGSTSTTIPLELKTTQAQSINFWTNSLQRTTILANGNVGFGTNFTTPLYQVDANDNININSSTPTCSTNNFINSGYRIGGELVLALPNDNSNAHNTFVGRSGNLSSSPGINNTYLGFEAGRWWSGSSSTNNTFIGVNAGYGVSSTNATGNNGNTFIGAESGKKNLGSDNTIIGYLAGQNSNSNGSTFIGDRAGLSCTTSNSTFIGYKSGFSNTSGKYNTFIGTTSGQTNILGEDNTFVGFQAGLNSTADFNTFMGSFSGKNNSTGEKNTFVGKEAGSANTTGINNCYIGNHSGSTSFSSSSNGSRNNYLGSYSGFSEINGNDNQQIGFEAGRLNAAGSRNVLMGSNSGDKLATLNDNDNIFIGFKSGYFHTGGANNTFIGSNSGNNILSTAISNSTAIGANCYVTQSNTLILGDFTTTPVNVGIGLSNPSAKLEIKDANIGISGLKFGNFNSASPITTTGTNGNVLAVDASGNVVLVADQTGSIGSANAVNGASVNATTKNIEWGQSILSSGDPGRLLHNTEIPMGLPTEHNLLNNIYFTGQSNTSSAPASISIGQAGSSVATLTLPQAKLDVLNYSTVNPVVNNNAGLFTTSGTYSGNTKSYLVGVKGVSEIFTHGNFNIGGDFEGKNSSVNYGVRGNALSTSSSQTNGVATNYGVAGYGYNSYGKGFGVFGAAVNNRFENYGVYGVATVPSSNINSTQYGVYGKVDCINKQKNFAIYGQVGTPGSLPTCALTNSWAGYFNGNVNANGTLFNTSDSILKENIETITGSVALNLINQLSPKSYNFRQNDFPSINLPSGNQFGLIAQQVERVIPNLVTDVVHPAYYDSLGNKIFDTVAFKALNYNAFIPILIAGVKQLNNNANGSSNGISISGNNQYEWGGTPLNHTTELNLNGNNLFFTDNSQSNTNTGFGHPISDLLEAKLDVINHCSDNSNLYAAKFLNVGGGCATGGTSTGVYGSSQVDNNATNIGGDFSAHHGRVNIGVRGTIDGTPDPTAPGEPNGNLAPGGYAIYGDAGNSTNFWAGYFNGYVGTTCGWFQASDGKLKENVKQLSVTSSRKIINQLRPSSYTFKTEDQKAMNLPSGNQYGLIAEDVEKVMPELVREMSVPARLDKNGKEISGAQTFKGVNYVGMIPVLISAIQQMDSTNSKLLERLEKQQKQIDALQNCCNFHSTVSSETPKGNVIDLSDLTIILDQNSPNPFAEQTTITYTIPESVKDAKIMFYTVNGVVLKSVQINDRNHGSLTVYGSNLSEGIYTYTLIADGKIIDSKKMICTKK